MYFMPQEIEVWYIIPAIRREIAKCLVKDFKTSYEKTGDILGVTKAAVSQYLKGKRTAKIKLPSQIGPKIYVSCKLLVAGKTNSIKETTKLLDFLKEGNLPCEVCGHLKEGILEDCKEIRFKDGNYYSFGEFPRTKTRSRRKRLKRRRNS
jgi:uncharacterized protein